MEVTLTRSPNLPYALTPCAENTANGVFQDDLTGDVPGAQCVDAICPRRLIGIGLSAWRRLVPHWRDRPRPRIRLFHFYRSDLQCVAFHVPGYFRIDLRFRVVGIGGAVGAILDSFYRQLIACLIECICLTLNYENEAGSGASRVALLRALVRVGAFSIY